MAHCFTFQHAFYFKMFADDTKAWCKIKSETDGITKEGRGGEAAKNKTLRYWPM